MAFLNLSNDYAKLRRLKSEEAKKALITYIRYAEHSKSQYGSDTQYWPEEAVDQLLKLEQTTQDGITTAERYEKARQTGGVCLADF